MQQKTISTEVHKSKASQGQAYRVLALMLALASTLSSPSYADRNKIQSIYFNSNSSIVIEAESALDIILDGKIIINNAKLSSQIPEELNGTAFDITIERSKSANKRIWNLNDQVNLKIKTKLGQNFQIETREILAGQVYEFSFVPDDFASLVKPINLTEATDDLPKEIHQLQASINEGIEHQLNQGRLEKFISKLNPELAKEVLDDQEFKTIGQEKIDSTSLVHLADSLVDAGQLEQALAAYREALELNPDNHNAQLALAKVSPDEAESLHNYLSSIDDEALMAVSETWYKEGRQSQDIKSIARGLVAYQFTILKNPKQANYRYQYAQALENSGPNFYQQAAQRYLEAAVLAKQEYQAGIESSETLLRDATEALILTQVKLGDFITASKYCNSYLNLGFKKFQNGKSILGLMKELEANRNPFHKELAMLGGYQFE